jgi:carbohydrate kinase (thermoresistant glucokinase family)
MSARPDIPNLVLIVMGVSGSGKSTVAEALNAHLHWPFQEGDALHPPSNVQKMHEGVPLTDADRAPWLAAIRTWIDARVAAGEPGLVTCSALKRRYRDGLVGGRAQVRLLYLQASAQVLQDRLDHRSGHFMPASLLESQLRTLEPPGPDERPIVVNVEGSLTQSVNASLLALRAV